MQCRLVVLCLLLVIRLRTVLIVYRVTRLPLSLMEASEGTAHRVLLRPLTSIMCRLLGTCMFTLCSRCNVLKVSRLPQYRRVLVPTFLLNT